MDKPLRPIANRLGGCFCLGSGPVLWVLFCFLLFASLFPLAKRKSGWGICGSSFFVWLWFSVLLFQSICRLQGPFVLVQCIFCLLSCKDRAFSATSATLEEKKYEVSQAQKAILLLPHTAKGASTSSEELNAQISPRTDDEHNLPYHEDDLQEH